MSGILRAPIGRAPVAVLAAAVASAGAGEALATAADPVAPELSLTWRAPAACPSAGDVEAQFARLLGGVHRQPTRKRLEATVTVRRTPSDSWVARLETRLDGVPGQRSLEGDSCWTVASAAALILALTIDPSAPNPQNAPGAASRPDPAPPATVAPIGGAPLPSPPAPSPSPPPARRPPGDLTTAPGVSSAELAWPVEVTTSSASRRPPMPRPLARAFGGLTVGLLPRAAVTGGVAAGLGFSPWRAELSAYATQQQHQTIARRPTAGGDFRLLAAGARLCRDLTAGRVIPRLCGGGELEHITAHGFGVTTPASGSSTMGAATLAGLLVFPVAGRVELSLDLGAAARPYRPTFTLTDVGAVFRVPGISWGAALSAGIAL